MSKDHQTSLIFPKWLDRLRPIVGVVLLVAPLYIGGIVYFGFSPRATDVGYAPDQPVPYSHALHAGELGIDCRYCHTTVEKAGFAAIPPTQTCMNCHTNIKVDSAELLPVRESYASGEPVQWVKVHDLADYAYFNHSVHVNRGVGCVECHGRVDKMEVVYQEERLSMGWCLECHRNPEPHLRPVEYVTTMDWTAEDREALGAQLKADHNINPPEDCSACHR